MKKKSTFYSHVIEIVTLFLVSLFAGCSLQSDKKENKWRERPADFHVSYKLFSGSISPPYQYEYTIEIGPGSDGKIQLQPTSRFGLDGPRVEYETAPWSEAFFLSDEEVKQLYELMSKSGIFNKRWKEDPSSMKIGGGAREMRVEGNGESIFVPSALKPADEEAVKSVYDAIEALVPKPLRAKLESERERYIEDHTINHRVPEN